jgi:hypothetical protein
MARSDGFRAIGLTLVVLAIFGCALLLGFEIGLAMLAVFC